MPHDHRLKDLVEVPMEEEHLSGVTRMKATITPIRPQPAEAILQRRLSTLVVIAAVADGIIPQISTKPLRLNLPERRARRRIRRIAGHALRKLGSGYQTMWEASERRRSRAGAQQWMTPAPTTTMHPKTQLAAYMGQVGVLESTTLGRTLEMILLFTSSNYEPHSPWFSAALFMLQPYPSFIILADNHASSF